MLRESFFTKKLVDSIRERERKKNRYYLKRRCYR